MDPLLGPCHGGRREVDRIDLESPPREVKCTASGPAAEIQGAPRPDQTVVDVRDEVLVGLSTKNGTDFSLSA